MGTAAGTVVSARSGTAAGTAPPHEDAALAVAVERVRELSLRLWAVRAAHSPLRTRLRGTRCTGCGQAFPCATVRAAAGAA